MSFIWCSVYSINRQICDIHNIILYYFEIIYVCIVYTSEHQKLDK